jgi:inner membrane protein
MEQQVPLSNTPISLLERFNKWIQESVMIKLFSIGFLILILLLPTSWIQEVMHERQYRASHVMDEIASKWSGAQTIGGPILIIPYKVKETIDRGKDGIEIREHERKAFFLPEDLKIKGNVTSQTLHRGIFDAAVYQSSLQIAANFNVPDFKKLSISADMVKWDEAYMVFGINDLRGITDNPVLTIGSDTITTEPASDIGVSIKTSGSATMQEREYATNFQPEVISSNGIRAKLNWINAEQFSGNVSLTLQLKGSKRLNFIPAGKTTDLQLTGDWKDPSFDGNAIPIHRNITEEGFSASWKVLNFNRPFSQAWTEANQELSGADFGVTLLVPVDQYQKSIRTAKYAVLIILLTFMALFLVEITHKVRIHPFQYILVGAALIIYYTLLLSLSEQVGYNVAYIISTILTVALITFYSRSFLLKTNLVVLFSLLLVVFYTFIFVIIRQQDYSLLLGSVGLFLMVGLLMYFSRKVKWYSN